MTIFYLVRHASCGGLGETLWGRTKGVRLNAQGQIEARQVAERFREVKLDAIYSSPLERTLETAEAIARVANLEVTQSPAFNEIDFGAWTGMSFAQLADDEQWKRFNTHRRITTIPGGESFLDVQKRTVAELNRLSLQHPNQRVAIVSHADVIKAAIGSAKDTPVELLQKIEIAPCSVTILITDEDEM
jgi:probable phosphoglycerate mutase